MIKSDSYVDYDTESEPLYGDIPGRYAIDVARTHPDFSKSFRELVSEFKELKCEERTA